MDSSDNDEHYRTPKPTDIISKPDNTGPEPTHAPKDQPRTARQASTDSEDGVTITGEEESRVAQTSEVPKVEATHLTLRFKDNEHHVHSYKLRKIDSMRRQMRDYALKVGLEFFKLRFLFDGERLTDTSTPEKLHMEDGDEVDVYQEAVGGGSMDDDIEADYEDVASQSSWSVISDAEECDFPQEDTDALKKHGSTKVGRNTQKHPEDGTDQRCHELKSLRVLSLDQNSKVAKEHAAVFHTNNAEPKQKSDADSKRKTMKRSSEDEIMPTNAQEVPYTAVFKQFEGASTSQDCTIRFHQRGQKSVSIELGMEAAMEIAFQAYATVREQPRDRFSFSHGGILVNPRETPLSLNIISESMMFVHTLPFKQTERYEKMVESANIAQSTSQAKASKVSKACERRDETTTETKSAITDDKRITISVRMGDETIFMYRQRATVDLRKVFRRVSEKVKYDRSKLRFLYDGQILFDADTPEKLDMCSGDYIDVYVGTYGGGRMDPPAEKKVESQHKNASSKPDKQRSGSKRPTVESGHAPSSANHTTMTSYMSSRIPTALKAGKGPSLVNAKVSTPNASHTPASVGQEKGSAVQPFVLPRPKETKKLRSAFEDRNKQQEHPVAAANANELNSKNDNHEASAARLDSSEMRKKHECPPQCKYCTEPKHAITFVQDGEQTKLLLRTSQHMGLAYDFYAHATRQEQEDLTFSCSGIEVQRDCPVGYLARQMNRVISVVRRAG